MISSFFKKTRNKRFEYSPRYYDEAREKMDERYDRIRSEIEGKAPTYSRERFRNNLRESWQQNKKTSTPQSRSIVRIIIISMILIVICYYILA